MDSGLRSGAGPQTHAWTRAPPWLFRAEPGERASCCSGPAVAVSFARRPLGVPFLATIPAGGLAPQAPPGGKVRCSRTRTIRREGGLGPPPRRPRTRLVQHGWQDFRRRRRRPAIQNAAEIADTVGRSRSEAPAEVKKPCCYRQRGAGSLTSRLCGWRVFARLELVETVTDPGLPAL